MHGIMDEAIRIKKKKERIKILIFGYAQKLISVA